MKYLAGLVNSRCVSFFYNLVLTGEGVRIGGGFHTYPETVRELPVFRLHDADGEKRDAANAIAEIVGKMIELDRQLQSAPGAEQTRLRRQFETLDREIDLLVYKLYGFSEEESRLVDQWTPAGDDTSAETDFEKDSLIDV